MCIIWPVRWKVNGHEDDSCAQSDVIIYLLEGRHLLIDAKVSIVAYNDYVNADNELARDFSLKRHLESVRSHIKGLSRKYYQELY